MVPMQADFIHMLFTAETLESVLLVHQASGRFVWIGRCNLRQRCSSVMTGGG